MKLTKEEREIEDAILSGKLKSIMTPESRRKITEAAKRSVAHRGGARPGAGRPTRIYTRANVLLSPRIKAKAQRIATRRGISLSRVVEDALAAIKD